MLLLSSLHVLPCLITVTTLQSPSSKNLTATSPSRGSRSIADLGLGTWQEAVNPHKGNLS